MPYRHILPAILLSLFVLPLAAQDETVYRSSFENNEVLNVVVDANLVPVIADQPGFDGGPPRPLALMQSEFGDGVSFHFVENEIYLITDDPQDLVGLQGRWPSTVLTQVDLDLLDTGATQDILYVLNVDPAAADPARIDSLEGATPTLLGDYSVSSEAALRLLALVASEIADHGLRVGINPVLEIDTMARRDIQEAVFGNDITDGALVYPYVRNPFAWPFAKREDQFPSSYTFPLNTGAAEAVRVVGEAGRLTRNVRVMIADAAFHPNEDFPPYDIVGGLRGVNPVGCGDGPPAPGTPCATHGTHVVTTGFGRNDNAFGTFGPGGEVADLLLLQSPSLDVSGFIRYFTEGLRAFSANPPDIVNISAGTSIPGGWCFIACEPLDVGIGLLRSSGILVVASAGNDNYNVDETDRFCFIACVEFEEAAIIPCELDGVLCIGASTSFQVNRAGYSNFGTSGGDGNSVDLYAPGNLYSVDALAADEANPVPNDNLQIVTGTSFAAPFTSGVLALTMAANPALTAVQAETCLRNSAYRPFSGSPSYLAINALGSVSCAMGGSHPFVDIVSPTPGRVYLRGAEVLALVANADDYEQGTALTIRWTSSLNGNLGNSSPGVEFRPSLLAMQLGNHQICANVTDASGRNASDCVSIEVQSSPPSATILQPSSLASFFVSWSINLAASTSDLDGPQPTGANVRGYLRRSGQAFGSPVATGLSATLPGGGRTPGDYQLKLEVTDSSGVTVERLRTIFIEEDPPNLPPEVTITSPRANETRVYDNAPVRFTVAATASDPEDGPIPFNQIQWSLRVNSGPAVPVTLQFFDFCFTPPIGPPVCTRTYYLDLLPAGGAASTRFDLRGRVQDSSGQSNPSTDGIRTFFITQLI